MFSFGSADLRLSIFPLRNTLNSSYHRTIRRGTAMTFTPPRRAHRYSLAFFLALFFAFALALSTLLAGSVRAQGFPNKPVTIVVPFAPGGGTDLGARLLAQKLGARWGQSVVIDNKGGAGGIVGAAGTAPELVNKIAADVKAVLDDEATRQALIQQGANPRSSTPAHLAALIESDRKRYAKIIIDKNISID